MLAAKCSGSGLSPALLEGSAANVPVDRAPRSGVDADFFSVDGTMNALPGLSGFAER
jgi:hypothetical protein